MSLARTFIIKMDDRQAGLSALPLRYIHVGEFELHTLDKIEVPVALWNTIGCNTISLRCHG